MGSSFRFTSVLVFLFLCPLVHAQSVKATLQDAAPENHHRVIHKQEARFQTGFQWVIAYRSWFSSLRREGWDLSFDLHDYDNFYQYRFDRFWLSERSGDWEPSQYEKAEAVFRDYLNLMHEFFRLPAEQQRVASNYLGQRYHEEEYVPPEVRFFPSSELFQLSERIVWSVVLTIEDAINRASQSEADRLFELYNAARKAQQVFFDEKAVRPDRVNPSLENLGFQLAMADIQGIRPQDCPSALIFDGRRDWVESSRPWGGGRSIGAIVERVAHTHLSIDRALFGLKLEFDQLAAAGELGSLSSERARIYSRLSFAHRALSQSSLAFDLETQLRGILVKQYADCFNER